MLHKLNADQETRAAFHRWSWNALNELPNLDSELKAIPSDVMAQFIKDVSDKSDSYKVKAVHFVFYF